MKALAITGLVLLLFSLAACNGVEPVTLTQTLTTTPTATTTQTVTTTQTTTATPTITPPSSAVHTPTPPATSGSHQVAIDNSRYFPQNITIKSGDSVTWTNKGLVSRTVTSWIIRLNVAGNSYLFIGDIFDSGDIEPGGTYTKVFDQAGLYEYASLPLYNYAHALIPAMMGSVTVTVD
jgi:plastocyanin